MLTFDRGLDPCIFSMRFLQTYVLFNGILETYN